MPVVQLDGQISFVQIGLAPSEVPKLLAQHRSEYSDTQDVEQRAKRLIAASGSREFVASVCKWGGGQRLVSRICKDGDATIARSATEAIEEGDVTLAIGELINLRYLGLSFASKVARFLAPDKCVVLDRVIRCRIGYVESSEGYTEFLQDCFQLLHMLRTSRDLDASFRDLRVCDVEAAVFMKAKEKNNNVSS